MATTVNVAGVPYSVPSLADEGWGDQVTGLLIALATSSKVLQSGGGNFPLIAEVDFGANYGLKSLYYKSRATNPSGTGSVRLGNTESISWRNAGNTSDLGLTVNGSDALVFNGSSLIVGGAPVQSAVTVSDTSTVDLALAANDLTAAVKSDSLTNAHINSAAGISQSKLSLSITDAEVNASAAISQSKLSLSIANAEVNAAAAIAYSKLNLSASIVNADVASGAAIGLSKLASTTASRALVSDGLGVITPSSVTSTELGYVAGVTSGIQAQFDAKQPLDADLTALAALAATGLVARTGSGTFAERTVTGTANQITVTNGDGVAGNPTLSLPASGMVIPGTGAVQLPAGTTAQRPAGVNSMIRYNADDAQFEGFADGEWGAIAGSGAGETNYITPTKATNGEDASTYEVFAETSNVLFTDSGDTVGAPGHNLSNGDTVSFTSITSTTGISTNTLYYVVGVTSSTFQVSLTSGGSAIALTTDGSGVMVQSKPLAAQPFLLGSPTLAFTAVSGSLVSGDSYFKIAKPASNVMGQGIRKQFNTAGPADYAKPMTLSFDVLTPSGYTDGDFAVWIHDNTNGTYIQPSAYRILKGTLVEKHVCEFQTASNSDDYDVVIFCATVGATAYDVLLDTLSVKPNTQTTGGIITTPVAYTPTFSSGFGTVSNVEVRSWREGAFLVVEGTFTAGVVTTAPGTFTLGFNGVNGGLTTVAQTPTFKKAGSYALNGTNTRHGGFILSQSGVNFLNIADGYAFSGTSVDALVASGVNNWCVVGQIISFQARVAIQGWGTSQVLSSETSSRIVDFSAYLSANQAMTANSTTLKPNTIRKDSHGAWNATTGVYTVPVPGDYRLSFTGIVTSASGGVYAHLNGAGYAYVCKIDTGLGSGSTFFSNLKAGDTISILFDTSLTVQGGSGTGGVWSQLNIERLSGPAQIAASETVSCKYYATSGVSGTSTAPFNFAGKSWDTHGAVTTGSNWKFTAPISGLYSVTVYTYPSSGSYIHYPFVDGILVSEAACGAATTSIGGGGASVVRLLAGQTLDMRPSGAGTLNNGTYNHITITRVGNY